MSEHRKYERFDCGVPVEGKEGGLFSESRTTDVSQGGVGFISEAKVPLNQEIAIELDMGEFEEPVIVIGKVTWVKPISGSHQYRLGMKFKEILSGSKTRLNKYFEQMAIDKLYY